MRERERDVLISESEESLKRARISPNGVVLTPCAVLLHAACEVRTQEPKDNPRVQEQAARACCTRKGPCWGVGDDSSRAVRWKTAGSAQLSCARCETCGFGGFRGAPERPSEAP